MVAAAHYPDPKTIYDPDPELKTSIITQYGAPVGGFTLGLAAQAIWNLVTKRPLRASMLMYIPWGVGTAVVFEAIHRSLAKYFSRRDTIHKHYIMLHPEDFPPPPKIKIGELLEDWNPVR